MKLYFKVIRSPVGNLKLVCSENALIGVLWDDSSEDRIRLPKMESNPDHEILFEVEQQLEEYFKGSRKSFDISIDPIGTEFQKKVWGELLKVPYGSTVSYGEMAERMGMPQSARAIGAANGKNPIAIIIPCHRVVGMNGELTGFAGGIAAKEKLLALEKLE